jgi:hypothetical protein
LTIATHASGVFGVGVEPPPESTEPSLNVATIVASPNGAERAPRSAWVIWPIFSSSVMRDRRSLTRRPIGALASRYTGSFAAGRSSLAELATDGSKEMNRMLITTNTDERVRMGALHLGIGAGPRPA